MTHPYQIIGIDHVVIRARNVEIMLDFYMRVIGCSVEKSLENLGLYQLRAGRSLIDLVDALGELEQKGGAVPDNEGHNMDHLCLRVDPWIIDDIQNHFKSCGVETGPVEKRNGAEGEGPSLYFHDPEGNVIEFKGPADTK